MRDDHKGTGILSEATADEAPSIRRVISLSDSDQEKVLHVHEIAGLVQHKILWGVFGDRGLLTKMTEARDIERLEDSDENATAFQKLYLKGLQEEPSAFGSTYEIEIKKTPEEVKAFLRDNFVVGVKYGFKGADGQRKEKMVATAQYKRKEGVESHIATIGKVYVHPAHRKRSIARTLMEHLLEHAEEEGVEQIHIIVTVSNEFAVQFYKNLGFVPGEIRYQAVIIDGEYYDWQPMMLSMHEYRSRQPKKAASTLQK